jgi:hypothetical protein
MKLVRNDDGVAGQNLSLIIVAATVTTMMNGTRPLSLSMPMRQPLQKGHTLHKEVEQPQHIHKTRCCPSCPLLRERLGPHSAGRWLSARQKGEELLWFCFSRAVVHYPAHNQLIV